MFVIDPNNYICLMFVSLFNVFTVTSFCVLLNGQFELVVIINVYEYVVLLFIFHFTVCFFRCNSIDLSLVPTQARIVHNVNVVIVPQNKRGRITKLKSSAQPKKLKQLNVNVNNIEITDT